jgi:hypothetical protein
MQLTLQVLVLFLDVLLLQYGQGSTDKGNTWKAIQDERVCKKPAQLPYTLSIVSHHSTAAAAVTPQHHTASSPATPSHNPVRATEIYVQHSAFSSTHRTGYHGMQLRGAQHTRL